MVTIGKLGKRPAVHDPRTLLFANYLRAAQLPPPQTDTDWSVFYVRDTAGRGWGMMGNDTLGDCTCAAMGHAVQCWTAAAQASALTVSDHAVLAAYEAVGHYNPADPSTDQGANVLDVLHYWRSTGIAAHRILGYVALEPGNDLHVRQAIDLFGGVYLGVLLPQTIQGQAVWSVPPGGPVGDAAPGTLGGHAVWIVAHDPTGLTCITWGQMQRMTWNFWDAYMDEAYACLSADFIHHGTAPSGFDLAALEADLQAV